MSCLAPVASAASKSAVDAQLQACQSSLKPEENIMIIVTGKGRMGPGELDRLQGEMAAMMAATHQEDGCIQYDFSRSMADPDVMLISERWRDQAALDAHFKTPHMATFNAAMGDAQVLELKVVSYEAADERVLIGG
jgi:quinol monooxygenase YgiN